LPVRVNFNTCVLIRVEPPRWPAKFDPIQTLSL
jgi:hypothetical protein